jgi:hypothetical protein
MSDDREPIGWDIYVTYGGDIGHPPQVDAERDYAGFVPNDGPDALSAALQRLGQDSRPAKNDDGMSETG